MDEIRYSSWLFERLSLGEVYRLRIGFSSIGRHQSSVIRILGSPYVSRHHAQIEVSEDNSIVKVEDLQSVNGIFVNDVHYLHKSVRLKPGDKIGIGVIVDDDVEKFDTRYPVFTLKYAPLSAQNACSKTEICSLSTNDVTHSSTTLTNNAGSIRDNKEAIEHSLISIPRTCNDFIVISDDDDENDEPIISVQRNDSNKLEENISSTFDPLVSRTNSGEINREDSTAQHRENIEAPNNANNASTMASLESLTSEGIKIKPENPNALKYIESSNKNVNATSLDNGRSSTGISTEIVTSEQIRADPSPVGYIEFSNKCPTTRSFHNGGNSARPSNEIVINEKHEVKQEHSSAVNYAECTSKGPSAIPLNNEVSPVETSIKILRNEPIKVELQDPNASENSESSDKSHMISIDKKMSSLQTSRVMVTSDQIEEDLENFNPQERTSTRPDSDILNSECTKSNPNSAQIVNNSVTEKSTCNSMTHIPMMSAVKQERVQTISADIQDIFGETDDIILEKLKDINPYVYNKCNSINSEATHNHLADGDCIDLLSDDECEQIALVVDPRGDVEKSIGDGEGSTSELQNLRVPKSPQFVNLSATDSEKSLTSKLNDKNFLEDPRSNAPKDVETNRDVSKDGNSISEGDDDENIFSQMVINDMKAELADENIDEFVEDLEKIVDEIEFDNEIQQKDSTNETMPLILPKCEPNNFCWNVNDVNDDYDEELETKVHDWSTKLFSQTLTQSNMSQIYEIDDEVEDDEESKDSKYEVYESAENESHFDPNFYTRHDEDVINELYMSLKEKYSPADSETIESTAINEEHTALEERQFEFSAMKRRIVDFSEEEYSSGNEEQGEHQEKEADEQTAPKENEFGLSPISRSKTTIKKRIFDSSDEEYNSDNEEQREHQEREADEQTAPKENEFGLSPISRSKTAIKKRIFDSSCEEYSSDNEEKEEFPKTEANDFLLINNVLNQENQNKLSYDEFSNSDLGKESTHVGPFVDIPKNVSMISNKTVDKLDKILELNLHKNTTGKLKVEKVSKSSFSGSPPIIIEPPKLPKYKGKLRGVSAAVYDSTQRKLKNIRSKLRINEVENDLKKKWQDPNWCSLKPDKEQSRNIKETRKERLKIIANKEKKTSDTAQKRKSSNEHNRAAFIKKPKVKVTDVNRGDFLTKEAEKPNTFKMTKTNDSIKRTKEGFSKSASSKNDGSLTLFEDVLNACDELNMKKSKDGEKQLSDSSQPTSSGHIISKSRTAARAVRTTNKITFASMQRNTFETHQNLKKLEFFSNNRSCLITKTRIDNTVEKKKKQVRFNDCLTIHFIERLHGAKKVDKKDVMPQSTFNDRRRRIRESYPIVDCSKNLITEFLVWGNEWLEKQNVDKQTAIETILPVPNNFTSFENYKNIFFPLMKLEFLSVIERDYREASIKPFKVALVYVTEYEDRLLLMTKYDNVNKARQNAPRCDLVILDFNDKRPGTFAYSSQNRKYGNFNSLTFEIVPTIYTKDYLMGVKEVTVKPIIDNIRIEVGAFNAVFQLESTPLFPKILNPLELLKHKVPPRLNYRYKGFDRLNDRQLHVLLCTYSKIIDETTSNVTLIKGPPGTGKSRVISNLALQLLYGEEVRIMDKKILICAQSNVAVDIIAAKLYHVQQRMRKEIQFRIIRYGIPDRISSHIAPITLQNLIKLDRMKKLAEQHKNINIEDKENFKSQMNLLKLQIDEMKTRNVQGTFEEVELFEKKKQLALFHSILNQSISPEDERNSYIWYLTNANIVCTTLSSCIKLSQYVDYFDVCIIDEATQCAEPWTLLPLKFGINSLVLVGDTQQLPATVISKKATSLGFGNSLFTRVQHCLESAHDNSASGVVFGLQTQYRMHPEICKWPNLYFYKNELINADITHSFKTPIAPFSIINLAYTQNEQCNYGKISNDLEAEFVAKLLKALDEYIPNKSNSYGVITPYSEHRKQLESTLRASDLKNIMVHTIDSYQGLEKDVIVISNARTQGVGFLSNYQRLNVALTRPKKCLILCGNFKHLEVVPTWRSLLNNARERNLYHEISVQNALDIHKNVIEQIKIQI